MKFNYLLVITLVGVALAVGCGKKEEPAEPDNETQTPTERQVEPAGGDEESSRAEPTEMDLLQGTWVGGMVGIDGEVKMVFSEEAAELEATVGGISYKGSVVINGETTPKQVDYTITECAMERYVGATSHGIYQFEDDNLVLAANEPGRPERPTEFQPMNGTQVFEFKREVTAKR